MVERELTTGEGRPELDVAYEAPRTAVEEELASIWTEVLGVSPIGVHDNFFDLGGDSLPVAQVVSRLREAFQVRLPRHCLFETPTIAGLTRSIETLRWAAQSASDQPGSSGDGLEEGEL
jgi:acyl carrier protein